MSRRGAAGAIALAVVLLAGCIQFEESGSFSAGTTEAETVRRVATGDVTGDGTDDALVHTSAGLVRYEVCGPGCFEREEQLVGSTLSFVADVDGDGIDDVHTGSRIYFGGAAEGGRPAGLTVDDSVALPSFATNPVDHGDFNGDGHLDLLRATPWMSYYLMYSLVFGDGAGGFTQGPDLGPSGPLNAMGAGQTVGDVDGDGDDEVVIYQGSSLWVVRANGSGFTVRGECCFPKTAFALGDIDSDGKDDLAWVQDDEVVFLRSAGTSFVLFPDYQTIAAPSSTTRLGLRDLSGDGVVDVLVSDTFGTDFSWWAGTNDGGFPYESAGVPAEVEVGRTDTFGDLDGDGLLDVLVPNGDPSAGVTFHRNVSEH